MKDCFIEENRLSKALINSDISHDEFNLVTDKEQNYLKLKASEQKMISWVTSKERGERIGDKV